jgi:hypothetical protein
MTSLRFQAWWRACTRSISKEQRKESSRPFFQLVSAGAIATVGLVGVLDSDSRCTSRMVKSLAWEGGDDTVQVDVNAQRSFKLIRLVDSFSYRSSFQFSSRMFGPHGTFCDNELMDSDEQYPSGYTESDRFFQCLEYHRYLLDDYERRWIGPNGEEATDSITWPRNVPTLDEIAALELDLTFCLKSPSYRRADAPKCEDKMFRIGSFYLQDTSHPEFLVKGFKMVKELAEHGHPDGMCLYGMFTENTRRDP